MTHLSLGERGGRMLATFLGVAACLLGFIAATLSHAALPALPALSIAVLLGIIAAQIAPLRRSLDAHAGTGIRFVARSFMRTGIVLLGFQLSLVSIAALGPLAVAAIVVLVVVTFTLTYVIGRTLRLAAVEAVLIAAGFSICGASAIGAMSAALNAKPRAGATPVALVTLFGTLAVFVLPTFAPLIGLQGESYGVWVGASVHDVGQVVAAAQIAGPAPLAAAVVVKLARVVMLAPMVAITSVIARRRADAPGGKRPPAVPLFVVGFLAAAAVTTFLDMPDVLLESIAWTQHVLLGTALFALGLGVRFADLRSSGWRALAVGLLSWVLIAVLALAVVAIAAP